MILSDYSLSCFHEMLRMFNFLACNGMSCLDSGDQAVGKSQAKTQRRKPAESIQACTDNTQRYDIIDTELLCDDENAVVFQRLPSQKADGATRSRTRGKSSSLNQNKSIIEPHLSARSPFVSKVCNCSLFYCNHRFRGCSSKNSTCVTDSFHTLHM